MREKLPFLRRLETKIVVNILGESPDDYRRLAGRLDSQAGVHAIELNISCPNVKRGGISFGSVPDEAFKVTAAVRKETGLPLIVKLSPNVTDIREMARAAESGGADSISLINTLLGMAIDVDARRPHLKNITGGLSGPAIKPIALRMVWQAAGAVSIPVIGIGGISTARDALEFLIAGATAVQVGTANFVNPAVTVDIIKGIEQYLFEKGISDIKGLIGSLII